jgi:hypothetical protein
MKETTQMKMFELLPSPLGSIFRKLTHFTCNSPKKQRRVAMAMGSPCDGSMKLTVRFAQIDHQKPKVDYPIRGIDYPFYPNEPSKTPNEPSKRPKWIVQNAVPPRRKLS